MTPDEEGRHPRGALAPARHRWGSEGGAKGASVDGVAMDSVSVDGMGWDGWCGSGWASVASVAMDNVEGVSMDGTVWTVWQWMVWPWTGRCGRCSHSLEWGLGARLDSGLPGSGLEVVGGTKGKPKKEK